jgi:hypothetical protein
MNVMKELKLSGWLRFAIWAMRAGFTVDEVISNSPKWQIEMFMKKTANNLAKELFYGAKP